jgi:hypothetical protein
MALYHSDDGQDYLYTSLFTLYYVFDPSKDENPKEIENDGFSCTDVIVNPDRGLLIHSGCEYPVNDFHSDNDETWYTKLCQCFQFFNVAYESTVCWILWDKIDRVESYDVYVASGNGSDYFSITGYFYDDTITLVSFKDFKHCESTSSSALLTSGLSVLLGSLYIFGTGFLTFMS